MNRLEGIYAAITVAVTLATWYGSKHISEGNGGKVYGFLMLASILAGLGCYCERMLGGYGVGSVVAVLMYASFVWMLLSMGFLVDILAASCIGLFGATSYVLLSLAGVVDLLAIADGELVSFCLELLRYSSKLGGLLTLGLVFCAALVEDLLRKGKRTLGFPCLGEVLVCFKEPDQRSE